jgi:DNA repair protein RadC
MNIQRPLFSDGSDPSLGLAPEETASERLEELLRVIPVRERPAHRAGYQARECSTLELLAAVVGGSRQIETASSILSRFGTPRALSRAGVHELISFNGIGFAKAAGIVAAMELGRRSTLPGERDAPVIRSPEDAAKLLIPSMATLEQEHLVVLNLDTRNRVIGDPVEIYHGSLNTSLVRVGELFRSALQANAAGIVVAHNHPSGAVAPSPEDVAITRVIREAGQLLDVPLIDHLIIGDGRFTSLKSKGLGFD